MRIWGYDISHHQDRFDHVAARRAGFDFCYAKATEGKDFQDPQFEANKDGALGAGMYFAAYHWLRSTSTAAAQASNVSKVLGKSKKHIPVIIDVEPVEENDVRISEPRLRHVKQFLAACEEVEVRVSMIYWPRWYWAELGKPGIRRLPPLINSDYGKEGDVGLPKDLYPGDDADAWNSFEGVRPEILQFTRRGIVGDAWPVCMDAYLGKESDLSKWFYRRAKSEEQPEPEPSRRAIDLDDILNPNQPVEEQRTVRRALNDINLVKARLNLLEDGLADVGSQIAELKSLVESVPDLEAIRGEMPNLEDIITNVADEVMLRMQTIRLVAGAEE